MSPGTHTTLLWKALKIVLVTLIAVIALYFLIMGHGLLRNIAGFTGLTTFVVVIILIRRYFFHRHSESSEVGYWSGLDNFEIGIDHDCFDELNLVEDDLIDNNYYKKTV